MRSQTQVVILGGAVDGVPDDFVQQLLPRDLERLELRIEPALNRVPTPGLTSTKGVINGPIPSTPGGRPLTGSAPGTGDFWWNEGHSHGITAAGDAGEQLAEWIVKGNPSIDMVGVKSHRCGAYANRNYLKAKNERLSSTFPSCATWTRSAPPCCPAKTSPTHFELPGPGAEKLLGRATACGHSVGQDFALTYVKPEFAEVGSSLAFESLCERFDVKVVPKSACYPANTSLKA